MTAEAFDTSGAVAMPWPHRSNEPREIVRWIDLPNDFVRGYIRAAFASLLAGFSRHERVTSLAGFSDIHPDTLASMLEDCEDANHTFHGARDADGGRAFWAWRQTGQSIAFPPLHLSLDPNGKVIAEHG